MRQFLLAASVAYTAAGTLNAIAPGAVGFYYNDNGELKVSADGSDFPDKGLLALGRSAATGGPITLPIHKNNFSFVKGVYAAATTFVGTVTIPAPTETGEYSIIVAKKGVKFNERNKWTASHYVANTSTTAAQLATALAASINANTASNGVVATVSTATITITAQTAGVDYKLIPVDKLSGAANTVTTIGSPAFGDAKYIIDLSNKAAADAGFSYTYDQGVSEIYPNYPLNPLSQANLADSGFTIFTLRFAEPRDVKTRDEIVHQIVQVAFPTGAAAIATFEGILEVLAGAEVEEEAG